MENLVKISEKIEMIKALGNICMFKESGTNDTLINVSRKKCIEIINSIQLGNEKL